MSGDRRQQRRGDLRDRLTWIRGAEDEDGQQCDEGAHDEETAAAGDRLVGG